MQQYIDISPYCDILSQWYSIDTIKLHQHIKYRGYIEYYT